MGRFTALAGPYPCRSSYIATLAATRPDNLVAIIATAIARHPYTPPPLQESRVHLSWIHPPRPAAIVVLPKLPNTSVLPAAYRIFDSYPGMVPLLPPLQVNLAPHEALFRVGDPSDSGIFIVVRGTLGVFLEDGPHATPVLFNTLRWVSDEDCITGLWRL